MTTIKQFKHIVFFGIILLSGCSHERKHSLPVDFPGGRIALLHDGNFRDPDDIGALPMCLAILQAAELNDRLVYIEHSHFLGCNDAQMEQEMEESMVEAWNRFGPFPNSNYYNYYRQTDLARAELIRVINESSEEEPLWIICAGRMESLYQAIEGAEPSKRKHLILVSHSIYNEDYTRDRSPRDSVCTGMIHTWDDIRQDFGADGMVFIESSDRQLFPDDPYLLTDQNESNGQYDFKSPLSNWEWLNDLGPDYAWLYSRNRVKNAFDVSDAGILWFVITGAIDTSHGTKVGCETCGWREVKELFEAYLEGAE